MHKTSQVKDSIAVAFQWIFWKISKLFSITSATRIDSYILPTTYHFPPKFSVRIAIILSTEPRTALWMITGRFFSSPSPLNKANWNHLSTIFTAIKRCRLLTYYLILPNTTYNFVTLKLKFIYFMHWLLSNLNIVLSSVKFSQGQKFANFSSFWWISFRKRDTSKVYHGHLFANEKLQHILRDRFLQISSYQGKTKVSQSLIE